MDDAAHTIETSTEIATIADLAVPRLQSYFTTPNGIDRLLGEIKARVESEVFDMSSAKSREACRSLAADVRRSRAALDKAGLALTEGWRKQTKAVNDQRNVVSDTLDALATKTRQPLTDWEAAEEAKAAWVKTEANKITDSHMMSAESSPEAILDRIEMLGAINLGDERFGESRETLEREMTRALDHLRDIHAAAQKREADARELAALRAEKEDRERKDREAAEAKAAEERRAAAEKAEAERQARIEKEKAEAAERARVEAEERAAREKQEAEERHQRELAEAKAEAERAAEAERKRQADEAAAAAAEAERRANDIRIRRKAIADLADALRALPSGNPDHDDMAEIAEGLIDGKIPNVKVTL